MIDFPLVKAQHTLWQMKFRNFLANPKQTLPEAGLVSHHECYLGKWLYSQGLSDYGDLAEFKSLERVHRQLHQLANSIIDLKTVGKISEARQEVDKMEPLCQEIISLLDRVEKQVKST